jgi:hypothetical protein
MRGALAMRVPADRRAPTIACLLLAALACGPDRERPAADSPAVAPLATDSAVAATCYASAHSILGREAAPAAGLTAIQPVPPDTLRGWLRVERGPTADSGRAWLVDSDRAGLGAAWRRLGGDSLLVSGADDFLRVELRLAADTATLRGTALATSDASFDRGPGGRLVEYRRAWALTAAPESCDAMPRPGGRNGA